MDHLSGVTGWQGIADPVQRVGAAFSVCCPTFPSCGGFFQLSSKQGEAKTEVPALLYRFPSPTLVYYAQDPVTLR